jgi:hypothetical protein
MFKRRTLFIVGAGASQEAGFPVGTELARRIGEAVTMTQRNEHSPAHFTDRPLWDEIVHSLGQDPQRRILKYRGAGGIISSGIRLANSIDDFLNIHSKNEYVTQLGKAAIVRTILQAEKESTLRVDPTNIYNKMDFSRIEQTWFVKLIRVLGPGGSPEAVEAVFKNISFIVFNYDRCIEHFLENALSALYAIERNVAAEIVKKITIIHPYGTIGELDKLPFGGDGYNTPAALSLAKRIKTYTERFEEGDELERIRHAMHNADCIVFLGYSYLEQNMALLKPEDLMDAKTVLGTAYKMSSNDRDVVADDMLKMFGEPQKANMRNSRRIILDTDATCSHLFDSYARTLNAA